MAQNSLTKSRAMDMTEGSPAKLILRFGLPLILANTLQQVYAMVDTIILGRHAGTMGLAVLGSSSWPVWLQVSILSNFSQACSILLAQRYGAGEKERFRNALANLYRLAAVLLLIMLPLLQLTVRPVLQWQNTPPALMEEAVIYLRITFWGTISVFLYNLFSACLRAIGDGKTPLYAIGFATAVNVLLDIWFVAHLGMGARGAAIATIAAQTASALICLRRVLKEESFRLQRKHFRRDDAVTRQFFDLSIPMLLQSFIIAFGGSFVQMHVNAYGEVFVAGMSATNKVFGMLETAAIALAQATATFVGQNYGAGRFGRIRRGIRVSLGIAMAIAVFLLTAMILFGRWILSLYVTPEAAEVSWGLLLTMSCFLLVMYPMYVLRQAIQALGNTRIPLLAALIQLVVRILVTLFLPILLGRAGLYFPTTLAWVSSLILIGAIFPGWLARCEREARRKTTGPQTEGRP